MTFYVGLQILYGFPYSYHEKSAEVFHVLVPPYRQFKADNIVPQELTVHVGTSVGLQQKSKTFPCIVPLHEWFVTHISMENVCKPTVAEKPIFEAAREI
jgi:hypothetical protein